MDLQPGTQIAYVPTHANGDLSHPDVEFGFVTSVRGDVAFCRYWSKGDGLRTTANSEATPISLLVPHVFKSPRTVADAMKRIEAQWQRTKTAWRECQL